MESLNYALEGRSLLSSDGVELPVDNFARSRNLLKEWNLNPFSDVGRSVISPNHEINEGAEFMESGLAEMLQKSPASSPGLRLSTTEKDENFRKLSLSNSRSEEFINHGNIKSCQSSKSSSVLSPLEPLLPAKRTQETNLHPDVHDTKEVKSSQSSKKNSDSSSAEPSVTVKRARIVNFSSQAIVCQVHGCNLDLSSSKDYHKRHKVCDEHSKTAKVVVNGIEQRFCQQCSRFHLLEEFDDDKRSCRKRLAGHNERRRKPQRDTHWDIAGSRFLDLTTERTISFLFPEILNGSYFCQERYELEAKPSCNSQLESPMVENSMCSHSLLSAHNVKVLSNSSGISNIHPTMATTNNNLAIPNLGMGTSSNFGLSELDAFGVLEVRDGNVGEQFEAQMDGNLETSDSMNLSYYVSPESGPTIDLQQLSTHLLRVEQQRSYMHR